MAIRLALVGVPPVWANEISCLRIRGAEISIAIESEREHVGRLPGTPIVADSVDALFADYVDAFDAVVVGVPDAEVAAGTIVAARNVHKAVAAPVEMIVHPEMRELVSTWDQHSPSLMLTGSHRYVPSLRVIQQTIADGQLGDPGLVRVHRWQPMEAIDPDPRQRLLKEIDVAVWLFDGLPNSVYAVGSSLEDNFVQVHLGFPQGGMAILDFAALPEGDSYCSVSLIGSTGAAYADDHHNRQLVFRGGPAQASATGEGDFDHWGELQEFVDAVAADRVPAMTCKHGLAVARVVDAAHTSWQTRESQVLVDGEYRPAQL